MTYLTVVPAYGKDFKSQKAVKEHFESNGDFLIQDIGSPDDGRYVNKQDLENYSAGPLTLKVRYKQLREICMIKTGKKK